MSIKRFKNYQHPDQFGKWLGYRIRKVEARKGRLDRLRIVTQVIFRGRKLCVLNGFVYRNREKEPAAMATGTFNVVSGRSMK